MTCLRNKRDSLALLDQKGFRPDIIIDIGAAGGTEGLYETWPQCRYVLVEPLSKFAPQLRAICSGLAQADYRIAAAGSRSGRLHIAYHPTEPYVAAVAQNAPADWPRDDIEMVTVDQLVAEERKRRSIHSVLLKVDVDGPEIDVLTGSIETLALSTVVVIEAPLHDKEVGRFGQIMSFMISRGYDCFDIIEPLFRPGDNILWQVDLVFVRRDSGLRSLFTYQLSS
jgi:FkbM family methyltransferase